MILEQMKPIMFIMSIHERVDNIVNTDVPPEQNHEKDKREKVTIIGDSMCNSSDSHGPSKSKKVSISNFPGAISEDNPEEIEDTLISPPDTLIVQAGTNDLTKSINTLRNAEKYAKKQKESRQIRRVYFQI